MPPPRRWRLHFTISILQFSFFNGLPSFDPPLPRPRFSQPEYTKGVRLALAAHDQGAGDLAGLLGIDVSLAYRLLRGDRLLTAAQIRTVARQYSLDPAALLEIALK